jgi:hypothetical protein
MPEWARAKGTQDWGFAGVTMRGWSAAVIEACRSTGGALAHAAAESATVATAAILQSPRTIASPAHFAASAASSWIIDRSISKARRFARSHLSGILSSKIRAIGRPLPIPRRFSACFPHVRRKT